MGSITQNSTGPSHSQTFVLKGKRIFVAGHRGMVGSALIRRLRSEDCEILVADKLHLDLRDPAAVLAWMKAERPDAIFMAAARVGGILANSTRPAEFLHENLMMESSVIDAAHKADVTKLLFLGSSCIYPRLAPQPIMESALMTGPLEPTNEWYAIAKIAGVKLAEAYRRQYGCDFVSAMPTNLYGPGDNYNLASSHVIPALIRKAHTAKLTGAPSFEIWGTGTARREFMYVDDCADALVHIIIHYSDNKHINVGTGSEVTILEAAELVCDAVEYTGTISRDETKPDGTPRKLMDSSRLFNLGWGPKISLRDGLAHTYQAYLSAPLTLQ